MSKAKICVGVGVFGIAILAFYLIFFKLTPWIASTLPNSSWNSFLKIVIYALVGYFGGIAIPVLILIFAVYLIIGDM